MGDSMELGTELHEAYQNFIETVAPMLLDEASFAAEFLLLYEGTTFEVPRLSTLETADGSSPMNKSAVKGPKQSLTTEGQSMIETLLGV